MKRILISWDSSNGIVMGAKVDDDVDTNTIQEELNNAKGYNRRTNEHIGKEDFDKELYNKYLTYEDYSNLKGLKVKTIYEWKLGEAFIFDRTFIHSSSTLKKKKIGLTIFFNRKIS